MSICDDIVKPYFVTEGSLPGLDFNRELHAPGTYDKFPEGVVGIRTDGDFWSVAALPWKYRDVTLRDIVAELWPEYLEQATFHPDSGSVEQQIYFTNQYAESEKERANHYRKRLTMAEQELDRLRAGRFSLHELHPKRRKASDNYFIRQYEHLLVAVAHEAIPLAAPQAGLCSTCGLYVSDRVHMEKYILRRAKGIHPAVECLADMTNDE